MAYRLIDPAGELFELQPSFAQDAPARGPEEDPIFLRIWLRELLTRAANREALRRLVHEDPLAPWEPLEDDELIDWLWNRIDQGGLRIVRVTRPGTEPIGPQHPMEPEEEPAGPAGDDPLTSYWVEIELIDMEDGPVPGERYIVKTPDGKTHEGRTGKTGVVRLVSKAPGSCELTFPDLDEEAWEPA